MGLFMTLVGILGIIGTMVCVVDFIKDKKVRHLAIAALFLTPPVHSIIMHGLSL